MRKSDKIRIGGMLLICLALIAGIFVTGIFNTKVY